METGLEIGPMATGRKATGLMATGAKETGQCKEDGLKETEPMEIGQEAAGVTEKMEATGKEDGLSKEIGNTDGLKETGSEDQPRVNGAIMATGHNKEDGPKEIGAMEAGLMEIGVTEIGVKETGQCKEDGLKVTGTMEAGLEIGPMETLPRETGPEAIGPKEIRLMEKLEETGNVESSNKD